MNEDWLISEEKPGCEVQCDLEWVECMEREDGSTMCQTHRNACMEDCRQ
jgi:hypothetical protein